MGRKSYDERVAVWGSAADRRHIIKVKALTKKLLLILGLGNSAVEVFVLGNKEMIALKKKFYPTKGGVANVLSFSEVSSFPHPERRTRLLGEIYLNRAFFREPGNMSALLIHGMLHLVGYDHERKRDMLTMQKKERRLTQRVAGTL